MKSTIRLKENTPANILEWQRNTKKYKRKIKNQTKRTNSPSNSEPVHPPTSATHPLIDIF